MPRANTELNMQPQIYFAFSVESPIFIYSITMRYFSTRVLINFNKSIRPLNSFSILKETHFDSPHIPSISLPPQPTEARFVCTSAVSGVISPRKILFLGVRADHTMASQSAPSQSVHDFIVKDIKGNDVDLSIYKGKVLLIVNVASQCGLTNGNYTELAQLYGKYKDQGLEILAFPCNQFGSQEPGSNEEIQEFACTRFKAEYPIFDKVDVNGSNAAPIYKFLKSSKGSLLGNDIKWNFAKFLIDKEGRIIDRYLPTTSPLSIEKDIKKLLEKA